MAKVVSFPKKVKIGDFESWVKQKKNSEDVQYLMGLKVEPVESFPDSVDSAPEYPEAHVTEEKTRTVHKEVCGCQFGGCEHTHQLTGEASDLPALIEANYKDTPIDEGAPAFAYNALETASEVIYKTFQDVFAFFNNQLFGGSIPECMITLQQVRRSSGVFKAQTWEGQNGQSGKTLDQIILNPYRFQGIPNADIEALKTLYLCMLNAMRFHYSLNNPDVKEPGRCYFDKLMSKTAIFHGVIPTVVDSKGNIKTDKHGNPKRVGQTVILDILPGGKFDALVQFLIIDQKFTLDWADVVDEFATKPKEEKKPTRDKYTCPVCETSVLGKFDYLPICGSCMMAALKKDPAKKAAFITAFEQFFMLNEECTNHPNAPTQNSTEAEEEQAA